ncbi:hypothetical protein HB39_12385 [Vibrio parahaemolyticus]|nr:hypothetical protein HB39_12385 [Vibrio parahaemolyticus]
MMSNQLLLMRYFYSETVATGQAIPLKQFRLDERRSRAFALMKLGRAVRELKRSIMNGFR